MTNNTNTNVDNEAVKVALKDALVAVRQAVLDLHIKIEAETDPIKKAELAAEMQALGGQIGLVFDNDKAAADQAAEELKNTSEKVNQAKEEIMKDAKPSLWVRFKAFIAAKWARTSQFVRDHKVAVSIGAAAAVIAAVGFYVSRNGTASVSLDHGFTEATITDNTIEVTSTDSNVDTAPTVFQKVGGVVINGAVYAKDLAVRGAVVAKDLALSAANKVGDFFTKKSVTPYTVTADVAVA